MSRRVPSYRPVESSDLPKICELEAESYPPDEAATPERLRYRAEVARDLFLVFLDGEPLTSSSPIIPATEVIGYICGTLATGDLTEATMTTHQSSGDNLCIHSVVVVQNMRRQGLGLSMMKLYLQYVVTLNLELTRISLLAKDYLLGFYQVNGFHIRGVSSVAHGKDTWYELTLGVRELQLMAADNTSSIHSD
mmetsp:Transcript_6543/g.13153  ORF Transcript_6543/g.13153 Transcript_6543/m.13153 type:complete len:193 (+) Transcript_6543:2066-2644(+)